MDYFPRALGNLVKWIDVQGAKRPVHGPTLGYTAAEMTAATAADTAVKAKITAADVAMTKARAAVTERDAAIDDYEATVRAQIARAKTASG